MKKLIFILSVFLISSLTILNAQTLKSILKNHYAAIGQTKINQAEAVVMVGKINQMGMELPFITYQKRPGKARFEASFQDMKIIQAFDGNKGWTINPMSGPEPTDMGLSEIKTMKDMAEIEGRLYNWKKKKYKVSYEGDEEFNGVKTYKIKVVMPDEDIETYYIGSDNYLVAKMDSKNKIQGMDVESTKIFTDYRDVSGCKMPFKLEILMMGQSAVEMTITSFEIKKGSEVPDELFVKPVTK
jgi:hypothetical protein